MIKPTIFFIVDIETTFEKRLAFDVAWEAVDRKGRSYAQGSYLAHDVLKLDFPFYKKKLGRYFLEVHNDEIIPLSFETIRERFNRDVKKLVDSGHRVIFCAYNAGFDSQYLGETSKIVLDKPFLEFPLEIMCIWEAWCRSAPKAYNYAKADTLNPKTSAEYVYMWEKRLHDYEELHIAFSDVQDEKFILKQVLDRKKKLPIVKTRKGLNNQPWRLLKTRPIFSDPTKLRLVIEKEK